MVLYSPDIRSLSLVLSAPEEIPGKSSEGPDSLTDANHLASKTMAYDFGKLSLDTLIAPVAKATVAFTSRFQSRSREGRRGVDVVPSARAAGIGRYGRCLNRHERRPLERRNRTDAVGKPRRLAQSDGRQ
ncbi:conserved hypothetical protein [Mesorhizobium delmotii]|uniref:Uncharacterized protein n=1 Tax=Mesorhizobium delmotii TaxID=1631247 RepID=A0A2P9AGM2_9HYPH|nr:conserved hypothetical protein [Mesorhizobium delmotii]